jgi:pimeloyl-ACP methyl ester carboxylesterase
VLGVLDARGVEHAVLVGHSYGGGVALTVAARWPERISALVLLAPVGPGCVTFLDRLAAAPVAGPAFSLLAWQLTPWAPRAWLARHGTATGAELARPRDVDLHVWANSRWDHGPLWQTFLTEQRSLVREADGLAAVAAQVRVPVLLIADPDDRLVPVETARQLDRLLANARLRLIDGPGHHLPQLAADVIAEEITRFLGASAGGSAAN